VPDCDYCGESFADEDAHLDHLAADHRDELSRIDERRVADRTDDGGPSVTMYAAGFLVVFVGAALAATFLLSGSNGTGPDGIPSPSNLGGVHEHGEINVTVDGRTLDFTQQRYQLQDDYFHFERGTDTWHVHGEGVTLAYAMQTIGIGANESCVTFEGETYCDSDPGTTVQVQVDGQPVTPREYVLDGADDLRRSASEGDRIEILVRT
jgi:hypothetical protein